MKRNFLLNRTLFLLFGLILVIPVLGINAAPESANYNVDPNDYTIDVVAGDSRMYVFQRIRVSAFDTSTITTEENEITMELNFGGNPGNITINEGTKVRVDVVSFNVTHIEMNFTYYILDGEVHYPDAVMLNRSSLVIRDDNGPR
ncbi:MAG: hypothetical protein ACTSRJ_07275, partial [Candidatus Hodarchaeales archaeon]